MVWVAGSSRAGYDYPGPWDRTVIVEVDSVAVYQGRPSMPGGLVPPFVPLEQIREGFVDIEVKTDG